MKKIGIVGIGNISGIYLKNITNLFQEIEVYAVCDLIRERAENAQKEYNVPKLYDTMEELFADPEVDIVLNLTRPVQHYAVSKGALLAGKHVYSEKPLAVTLEQGKELVELATANGLRLGGAPDTFLGAGFQTVRKAIDDGMIGKPIGFRACMSTHGMEDWHPDPEFFFKFGGGPLFDMGPYYLTALINLLGGVKKVTSVARSALHERTITSQPHYGEKIAVEVPTYYDTILHFDNGITGDLFTTFDVYSYPHSYFWQVEIYGTQGTILASDPNSYGGPIKIFLPKDGELRELPLMFDYRENSRGLGLADMAKAIEENRPARAEWDQTLHVLEIMDLAKKSSDAGQTLELTTHYERHPAMNNEWQTGYLG